MGQYHLVANYDRKEFINPHVFGDGVKLMEFGASGDGTMLALAILLAASCTPEARGGGDIHPWLGGPGYEGRAVKMDAARCDWLMQNIVGRWAGERIAIIGDYAEPTDAKGLVGKEGSPDGDNGWTDISSDALEAMLMDFYTNESFNKHKKEMADLMAGV